MSDFIQWTYENRYQISIDLAAGSISGIANCISSHPLDTVKVRMQMSEDGVVTTLRKIINNEGVKGFYKGMSFPILSIPITNAVVFSVYEFWRKFFIGNSNKQLTYFQTAFCGSIAGSSAALFSCPIELTKCKLQMQETEKIYKNPIDCVFQIYKKEGLKYIFRGMHATQQREILGYSAQFAVYEFIKDILCDLSQKAEPSTANLLISGGLAGVSCWTIGYPQDTIKTILQYVMMEGFWIVSVLFGKDTQFVSFGHFTLMQSGFTRTNWPKNNQPHSINFDVNILNVYISFKFCTYYLIIQIVIKHCNRYFILSFGKYQQDIQINIAPISYGQQSSNMTYQLSYICNLLLSLPDVNIINYTVRYLIKGKNVYKL
ncbi:unnamed protein product (macronuclear) [Paramecium tetraurelia]|uniref:Mitochondrial carrier protein n=1 Tax=Paramecium tetraurelia TaxID=5888 RepID=A0DQ84_PARTE|nr:uncharacterized protein GSPATT00002601001 [Paramecium tetraurelia]CAK85201.1 unnamed protein product [Paramecium tetraurelia]|eukprot:XP_001452598.1 hypothetical protein (macronuclear) [Paramecium tetraurelia strain d4-2]